jgi:hypothetical protein
MNMPSVSAGLAAELHSVAAGSQIGLTLTARHVYAMPVVSTAVRRAVLFQRLLTCCVLLW